MANSFDAVEDLHPSAQRVVDELKSRGVEGPFREFDVPTKTAADAAAALGCNVGAIASTLVFIVDDEPVVVIKSGAFRVDLETLAVGAGGAHVRQAKPDEVRGATGQAIGGVSPVGWPTPLRTFIDDSLREYDVLWAACGTPNSVFRTNFEQLQSITGGTVISFRPL
jgi:prolyl-tRNA editing enzyme YbaK/EbsC (Cys-tRNA(Pro) deacylase)